MECCPQRCPFSVTGSALLRGASSPPASPQPRIDCPIDHEHEHSEGHVSLWREADRALLAGDAFVTTQQESAYAAFTQKPEVHGPPMYYTPDWVAAHESVKRLAMLNPNVAGTGHGIPYHGAALREALNLLARDFMEVAVPKRGRYVPYGLR
ncbi:MAG TPA: MBL fold metallo-hydrolase, partial [Rhodothermales bacterium]|nr:MBL fold metallo-hydrolase [Rhodothermales bacterium]